MDYQTVCLKVGSQVRKLRKNRGLKQADLAMTAGITRQKLIEIEKGSPSVALQAYARVFAALGCELRLMPATRPTLDEVEELFK